MMINKRGFTLLEVIIVIGMIGILAAISTPTVMSWIPNYKLKAAARDLYSAAMKAKSEAVKRKQNCALTFNQSVGGVTQAYVIFVDTDKNCELDAGEVIIYQMTEWDSTVELDTAKGGGDGLTFTDNDDGNPTIAFRSNGITTGNGGGFANGTAFLINTKGTKREVTVNQAGNVRID